jgi:hypothetical protein
VRTVVDSQGTVWTLEEAQPCEASESSRGRARPRATLVRCTAGDRAVLIVAPRNSWRTMSDEQLLRAIAPAEQPGWRPQR